MTDSVDILMETMCVFLLSGEIINLHKPLGSNQKWSDFRNEERDEVLISSEFVCRYEVFTSPGTFRWSRYLLRKCEIFRMLETVLTVCRGEKPQAQCAVLQI